MTSEGTVRVLIPTPLRRFTDGEARVEASGGTIGELLDDLDRRFPGLAERIRDEEGEIRRFVNVFVNGTNARERDGAATALAPGDEVGIIPAMAGGR